MNYFKLDLFYIFSFIIIAQMTESYNIYAVNKYGRISKPSDVVHVDSKNINPIMREKLIKQLNAYLRKPKSAKRSQFQKVLSSVRGRKHSKHDYNDFRSIINSPVVYSNGRYTLDLDTINLKDIASIVTNPSNDADYDSMENLPDYYDYESINDRLDNNRKILKTLAKYLRGEVSFRKYNTLLGDEKYFRSRNLYDSEEKIVKKRKRYFPKKRFQVIDNNKKKKKHNNDDSWEKETKMTKIKPQYDSDYYKPVKDDFSSEERMKKKREKKKKKKHKKKKSEEESDEYVNDGSMYLQGNVLIKIKSNHEYADNVDSSDNGDSSDDEKEREKDRRRRLPHFLPKRYHWEPDDIHKLGYFWFNGPKGKYPYPVLAD